MASNRNECLFVQLSKWHQRIWELHPKWIFWICQFIVPIEACEQLHELLQIFILHKNETKLLYKTVVSMLESVFDSILLNTAAYKHGLHGLPTHTLIITLKLTWLLIQPTGSLSHIHYVGTHKTHLVYSSPSMHGRTSTPVPQPCKGFFFYLNDLWISLVNM